MKDSIRDSVWICCRTSLEVYPPPRAEERRRRIRRSRQEAANPEAHDHDHDHEHDHEGHDHDHDHAAETEPDVGGGDTEAIVAAEDEAGIVDEDGPVNVQETDDSAAEDRGEAGQ